MTNITTVAPILTGPAPLNSRQIAARFPFLNTTKQCRMRQKGGAFRWFAIDGQYYAYEHEIIAWLESKAINSTAELPVDFHSKNFQHLESARAKAYQKRNIEKLGAAQ
jgi:hypothetical protein